MTDRFPKRRKWFQFRLRTLLIAVLVLSLPLSWVAVRMDRARRQREAVEEIERLRGLVLYDWETPPPQTVGRTVLGNDFFDEVVLVDLAHSLVRDARLEHLAGLTNLHYLWLDDTHITDAGLEHLTGLTNLEILTIRDNNVTPKGIQKLQQALPNCVIEY